MSQRALQHSAALNAPQNAQQYCTLFDAAYLSRGLVLYQSLVSHAIHFHLYVLAMDDVCAKILREKNLQFLTVISLADFESPELLAVKTQRTRGEYCWTCTPFIIGYCIDTFKLAECTYIDADICFFSNPLALLNEIPVNKNVLITEHRYSPAYDQTKTSGRFCVQFVTFKNTIMGREILSNWTQQCHEWCFDRIEENRFGDQKYQDVWPEKWPNDVHILEHLGGGVAPWNVQQYTISKQDDRLILQDSAGNNAELVFYHFHALKFISNNACLLSTYDLSEQVQLLLYTFYMNQLANIAKNLNVPLPLGPIVKPPTFFKRHLRLLKGKKPTPQNIITL